MTPETAAERAATRLLRDGDELARAVTEALYAERPDLAARYGPSGRDRCLQDLRFNVEHLAPAVALGDETLFVTYARWLADLLAARGIPTGDVTRSLELMEEAVTARMPEDEAAAVRAPLRAGLRAIGESGSERGR